MAVGAVVARILTQYSDKGSKAAQKDLIKLGKSFDAYAKKASRAVGLVAVATAAAAVKIGKDSVMAASDVSQQFGALDAVFKSNSKELKDFSKTMVEYGLSTADSARFSALLGTQLTGLGLAQQDAIDRTKTLQILAADLAATYGGTTADAVAALSSTFKGEYNPIERYGVAIRKSDITARVAAKGLKGLTGEALKAAEAQAAYELILNKTTAAQGQSGREFNTLAAQLQRLNASYTNIQASLGEALLPVVQEFAGYLLKDVIPGIQKWVDVNRDELAESLKQAAKLAGEFLRFAGKIAQWATDNIGKVKAIGIAIASLFIVSKAVTFFTTILQMITSLKALKTQADQTNASTSKIGLLGKVGAAAAIATVAIPGISAYNDAVKKQLDGIQDLDKLERQLFAAQLRRDPYSQTMIKRRIEKLKEELALVEKLRKEQEKFVSRGVIPYQIGLYTPSEYKKAQADIENTAKIEAAAAAAAIESTTKQIALDKKAALEKIKIDAKVAAIRKTLNIKSKSEIEKETDLKQLNAAEALLKRQKEIDSADLDRVNRLKEEVFNLKVRNDLAKRYQDILTALADQKIDTNEVLVLSKLWNIPVEAVQTYLLQLKILEDKKISDSEIVDLAKSWGSTQAQAAQYLDFFQALNDGYLDPSEIDKLRTKWGMTEQQVRMYSDLVGIVNDGKLEDAEIIKIQGKWKLTTDQVVDYIKKIGSPVSYSGTLIDPANAATIGWKNAKDALQAYLDLLGKGTTKTSPVPDTPSPTLPQPSTGNVGNIDTVNKQVASAAEQLVREITATGKSAVSISEVANTMASSLLADKASTAALGGVSGVLSSARYTGQALQYAAQQAAQERQAAASSSTVNTAASIGTPFGQAGTTNVTVNVQGSVTSENDLVQSIRNGLLRAQYNGNQINLAAL